MRLHYADTSPATGILGITASSCWVAHVIGEPVGGDQRQRWQMWDTHTHTHTRSTAAGLDWSICWDGRDEKLVSNLTWCPKLLPRLGPPCSPVFCTLHPDPSPMTHNTANAIYMTKIGFLGRCYAKFAKPCSNKL